MSKQQIRDIVDIMLTADSGGPYCARYLLRRLKGLYPKRGKMIDEMYRMEFSEEVGEEE